MNNDYDLKKVKTLSEFKVTEYLTSPETTAAFLNEIFSTDNASFIAGILGEICKAKGMAEIAKKTGIRREALYKALRNDPASQPSFNTIIKVIQVLGFRLEVEQLTSNRPNTTNTF